MNADRHFDESGTVQSVDFDWSAVDTEEATAAELSALQRELMRDALEFARHSGFVAGEAAAEAAVIDRLLSGRPTPGAVLTRLAALARKHGRISTATACRLTGRTSRALRKAFAKVPPVASDI